MQSLKNQILEIISEDCRTPLERIAVMTGAALSEVAQAIEELEKQMESAASEYTKLEALMAEKSAKEAELEAKMERWVYLNDLAERIEAQKKEG